MRRLSHILFWSVISAAFIGPGTVTTAASSGTRFGFTLLWALLFSTVACLVLQEASARVAVVSGRPLARAIREQFHGNAAGVLVVVMVLGAIVLGCAAYEAGNILGAAAGASLGTSIHTAVLTVAIGVISALLLCFGSTALVARVLGFVVAAMGVTFLVTAILIKPPLGALLKGTFTPALPPDSKLLVLGLVGTTVVPYNLFLGSGIAMGQKLGELRFGLAAAVIFGGLISMGVLVVGTSVSGVFGFDKLSTALTAQLGEWAGLFFAFGLFAAGLSSAITAPLAASITAKGLFSAGNNYENDRQWTERSWRYRSVWAGVLITGVSFGLAGVRPIPAIIVAQALNGVLLPFVAVFLLLVINDPRVMGDKGVNGIVSNIAMTTVVAVTVVLGVSKTAQAAATAFRLSPPAEGTLAVLSGAVAALLAWPVVRSIRKRRSAYLSEKSPRGDIR